VAPGVVLREDNPTFLAFYVRNSEKLQVRKDCTQFALPGAVAAGQCMTVTAPSAHVCDPQPFSVDPGMSERCAQPVAPLNITHMTKSRNLLNEPLLDK
jgi:hypothetical protein